MKDYNHMGYIKGFTPFFYLVFLTLWTWTPGLLGQSVSLQEPIENWRSLLKSSGVETRYKVKKGDTLYDVSEILFGDAHYWPKIWSINGILTNPHEISVGQIIYFDSGNVTTPPSVSFKTSQGGTHLVAESYLQPIIPKQAPKLYLKQLPGSLPYFFAKSVLKEEALLKNIEVGRRLVLEQKQAVTLYTEILPETPNSLGQVDAIENGAVFAKVGDFVTLILDRSRKDQSVQISQGQKLGLFNLAKRKRSFAIVDWIGEIEVIRPVDGSQREYKALVTRANKGIARGTKVGTTLLKSFTYNNPGDQAKLSTNNLKILGGEGVLNRKIFNDGDLVYLNKGLNDNVNLSDVYSIKRSLKKFFTYRKKMKDVPGSSGFVKIISVNDRYSTGVLYYMTDLVYLGSKTRTKIN